VPDLVWTINSLQKSVNDELRVTDTLVNHPRTSLLGRGRSRIDGQNAAAAGFRAFVDCGIESQIHLTATTSQAPLSMLGVRTHHNMVVPRSGFFYLITNDLQAICQFRATLHVIVEFDLKYLPVPVTAVTQHFHIAFAVNQ
jgi:hypothetical protein